MKKVVAKKGLKTKKSQWPMIGLVVVGLLLMLALLLNMQKSQDNRSDARGGKSSGSNPLKMGNYFKTVEKVKLQKTDDVTNPPVLNAKKDGNRPTAVPTTKYMYR